MEIEPALDDEPDEEPKVAHCEVMNENYVDLILDETTQRIKILWSDLFLGLNK